MTHRQSMQTDLKIPQMLKLANKDFKIVIITMLKDKEENILQLKKRERTDKSKVYI